MKSKLAIAAALMALISLLVWGNLRQLSGVPASQAYGPKGPSGAPLVKVIPVEARDLSQTVLAPGELEVSTMYQVRAPFATPRVTLLVTEGDTVTEGQTIARLKGDDMRLQVANLETALVRAESALARLLQRQQAEPVLAEQRLAVARSQVSQAEQGLQAAIETQSTSRYISGAGQRVEQARAYLVDVQTRAARLGEQVMPSRERVEAAQTAYMTSPHSQDAQQALDAARADHEAILRQDEENAHQMAAELTQAQEALRVAERELESETESPAVHQARNTLDNARHALVTAQIEVETGRVLKQEIRAAVSEVAGARESLQQARSQLEQAEIRASVTGRVLTTGLRDGQPAQQGQLLVELGNLELLTVKLRVDELDVARIQVGQSLTLKAPAFPRERFAGKITRVAAQSKSPVSGAPGAYFEVQGEIDNRSGKLLAGMSAESRILTDFRSQTLVVGLESVREEGDQASVLVVKEFQVALRSVSLGLRTQTRVEVLTGLAEGDQVIVSPFTLVRSLKDGESVRVEEAEEYDWGDDE